MRVFPTEKFKIEAEMTREEVVSRLRNVTGERRFFKLRREKPFEGEIYDDHFRIQYVGVVSTWGGIQEQRDRWITFDDPKNKSARELDILGSFKEDGNKTVLLLNINLTTTVKAFFIGWMLFLMPLIFISFLVEWDFSPFFLLIPAAMIVFVCLGIHVIFKSAIREIKQLLTAILKKQEEES
jgi:hypothetical protein